MDKVYIVASTLADIGKGWLAGSIASLLEGNPVKIDPALFALYGLDEIVNLDCSLISTDVSTYRKLGLTIKPNEIIDNGGILYEFLNGTKKHILDFNLPAEKRPTLADVSETLSDKLEALVKRNGYSTLVIEMGGSVYDEEVPYLANGVRRLANFNKVDLDVVLLSYFESSDDKHHAVKVNNVVNGIREAARVYWREPRYVFVRDRTTNGHLSQEQINYHIDKISHRTHIPPERIIYEPNFETPVQLRDYLRSLNLFKTPRIPLQIAVDNS